MNAPIIITPVTQDQVNKLIEELRANKTTVTPDAGAPGTFSIEGHGIGSTAVLNGSTLTVSVVHKPFFVTMGEIESGLHKALEA